MVRLRYNGKSIQVALEEKSTLEELLLAIESNFKIVRTSQLIKLGFPPKPLKFNDTQVLLKDVGISQNELLIVENDANGLAKMLLIGDSTSSQVNGDFRNKSLVENKAKCVSSSTSSCLGEGADKSVSSFLSCLNGCGSVNNEVDLGSSCCSSNVCGNASAVSSSEKEGNLASPFPYFELTDSNLIGEIKRYVVPSDNSCLFTCIKFLVDPSKTSMQMREIACNFILSHPEKYSDVMLGKPQAEYVAWLKNPTSWGGFMELSVFADFYKMQFAVQDIQTLRLQLYGVGEEYSKFRAFLLYDGVHYDALCAEKLSCSSGLNCREPSAKKLVKIFSTEDVLAEIKVKSLAEDLNRKQMYTNMHGMSLRCIECQTPLRGQKEAQQHAKATNHVSFAQL